MLVENRMLSELCAPDFAFFLKALAFAAEKHMNKRRKGKGHPPYINHLIDVVDLLWTVGEVRDIDVLVAGMLHDTVEDTGTTLDIIEQQFNKRVSGLVMEMTDDKSKSKAARKQAQIDHADKLSPGAQQIKLADKISNDAELTKNSPANWGIKRRREYLDWSEKVVVRLLQPNKGLLDKFYATLEDGRQKLGQEINHPK